MRDSGRSALVGRAREREAIAAALRAVPARAGPVVAIEGEPGIGKSRLLEHLAESAAEAGATVVGGARRSSSTTSPTRCGRRRWIGTWRRPASPG